MNQKVLNWGIFILLSIIWGSSFLLMKIGMKPGQIQLSPFQVASLRMIFSGLALTPFAYKAFKQIPKDKLFIVILSGILGNFIPAYLFCIAETKIDSALAGILNSLTPLFTIIVGIFFFQLDSNGKKILGVLLGLVGLCLSVAAGKTISLDNFSYSFYVMIATIFYGINVNMVGRHMHHISAINIAALAFGFCIIPATIILYSTGYFQLDFHDAGFQQASTAGAVLGIINTTVASILFYQLVKRAGIVFASMVTYAIPFVSLVMGLYYNEPIHPLRLVGLMIILFGVYIVNRKEKKLA
jgi:drug/metabolite transporter (DMT)-like permease